jgi:hypothetical protein
LVFVQCKGPSKQGADLEKDFQNPPESAKPRVWWHWMNGNITKEGIRADLEWMHRVGIGGFQNFDAALMTPQIVGKRLVYMTPEWKDAFLFTTKLADSLGLGKTGTGHEKARMERNPYRRRKTFLGHSAQTSFHNRSLSEFVNTGGILFNWSEGNASA